MNKSNQPSIKVYMPEWMIEEITDIAREEERSISGQVLYWIKQYLKEHATEPIQDMGKTKEHK